MSKSSIADLRKDYKLASLEVNDVAGNPIIQFKKWFDDALNSSLSESNAMTLATAGKDGKPSARVVLLKEVSHSGFVFFTNYESKKGKQLNENPFGALCFNWLELERQVRIEGSIIKISYEASKAYFDSRPYASRIGALASHQSREIGSREELQKRFDELYQEYEGKEVPMPNYWGGFELIPNEIEFWQGRPGRLHDRIQYMLENGNWQIKRLNP